MESAYNFKLQKLLDIRIDLEEESKRSFQRVQGEKLKVEEQLEDLQNSYEKYTEVKYDETLIEKKIKRNYLNSLSFTIEETEKALEKKENELMKCLEDLKLKQINRKTVDTLKEKEYIEFLLEQNLKEQKLNDEFALYGYIRQTAEGR